jgi:hypothetical protein
MHQLNTRVHQPAPEVTVTLLRRSRQASSQVPRTIRRAVTVAVAGLSLLSMSFLGAIAVAPTAASAVSAPRASIASNEHISVTVQELNFVALPPVITGTRDVGSVLTATIAWLPTPDRVSYQWRRSGKSISGATRQAYKVDKGDAGHHLSVTVSGAKSGYTTLQLTSAQTSIKKLLTATPIPRISGLAAPGHKLKAITGKWSPTGVRVHYAWMIDGYVVGTTSSYTVRSADSGKLIAVWVTGSKSGYASVTRMSLNHRIS